MRYLIYHDSDSRTTVIEGLQDVFPEGSLKAVNLGLGKIGIDHRAGAHRVFGPIDFARLAKGDGTGFSSVFDCLAYLSDELDKRTETGVVWSSSEW